MPLLKIEEIIPQVNAAIWELNESLAKLQSLYVVPQNEEKLFHEIHLESRKKEWLASRILHQLLCGNTAQLYYDEHGKPYSDSKLFISITHSKNYVMVVASKTIETGVDMELIAEKIIRIKDKFVGTEEEKLKQEFGVISDATFYHILWSFKEAAYKLYGKKKLIFKDQIVSNHFCKNQSLLTGNLMLGNKQIAIETKVFYKYESVICICYYKN
jgi:phosphopantetheinyl transferase